LHGHKDLCVAHNMGEVEDRIMKLVIADYCYFGHCVSKKEKDKLIEGPGCVLVVCDTDSGAMMSCQFRTKYISRRPQ
jgi:hypothetical protein